MLFIPSLCLPSVGNGNLCWALLSVEARMLDTASTTHDGSLLRRGFAEKSTAAAGKRRLLLVLPLQLREGVAEEHPSSLLQ
ncbi:hypothetical protein D5086_001999 [Populus alba]|uniref:Uncharacterized protein n=2 Tax=Populus alba TaxID=43335 RepID=A0ACC4D0U8_POPAL